MARDNSGPLMCAPAMGVAPARTVTRAERIAVPAKSNGKVANDVDEIVLVRSRRIITVRGLFKVVGRTAPRILDEDEFAYLDE